MDGVDVIVANWAVARPELDVSALRVFGRLHRSFLVYKSCIAETFERHEITDSGFDVLVCLRRAVPHHRLTAGQLAEQTLVTTGGLSLRVNRLQEAGLVTRTRDATDARIVYVEMTARGRGLVDVIADEHFAVLQSMVSGLDESEVTTLELLLRRLESSARAARTNPGITTAAADLTG